MDAVDRFVQDGVFNQHSHIYTFGGGETKQQREQWLQEAKDTCREAGVEYVVRETTKDGKPGYEFGFADVQHYAAFVFNVFGDLEGRGQHIQRIADLKDPAYQETYRQSAELHLKALRMNYKVEKDGSELRFKFDRFSDRIMFQTLVDNGTIDHSASSLAQVRSLQNRLGVSPTADNNKHWLDFDFG